MARDAPPAAPGPTPALGPVFVINLPSRADRREEMQAQLRRIHLGWDSPRVTRFDAVRPAQAAPFESIGAHGCFMSHLGVLEQARRRGLSSVLILEDDCNFVADIAQRLPAVNAVLEAEDWSFFYGGCLLQGTERPQPVPGRAVVEMPGEVPLWLAHCVAVRGEALRLLPEYLRALLSRPLGDPAGGPMDVDGAYCWFRRAHPRLRTLVAAPEIAYQRSSRTDISPLTWRDRWPLVRDAVRLGRRVRNRLRVR